MKVRWQKLLLAITFWSATEIWFNLLGIDNLADYSEFIFERNRESGVCQKLVLTIPHSQLPTLQKRCLYC
jgi:hypothetical protein